MCFTGSVYCSSLHSWYCSGVFLCFFPPFSHTRKRHIMWSAFKAETLLVHLLDLKSSSRIFKTGPCIEVMALVLQKVSAESHECSVMLRDWSDCGSFFFFPWSVFLRLVKQLYDTLRKWIRPRVLTFWILLCLVKSAEAVTKTTPHPWDFRVRHPFRRSFCLRLQGVDFTLTSRTCC